RVRRVHRARRRRAALLVLVPHPSCARQARGHDRRACRRDHRQIERGPAGCCRRAGLPVRVLHARLRHGGHRLPEDESEPDAPGTRAWRLRQPVPLPGLRQDSHRADARRRAHEECVMAAKLVGQDYTTPDLVAKVTGKAKYAEDYRVEGMLFCKLLLSPYPHARVKRIDASQALAMDGVKGILTADDLPAPADVVTDLGVRIAANTKGEKALASEPVYQGEPVLAVAAVDELTATNALEKIGWEGEQLPCGVDPLASLRPGGPNARLEGNVWGRPKPPEPGKPVAPPAMEELKWTEAEFADYDQGKLPMGKTPDEWSVGNI